MVSTEYQVLGKLAPPNDVGSFAGKWNSVKRTITLNWDEVRNIDLSHYEIRQGTNWDDAVIVEKEAKKGSTSFFVEEGVSETRTYLIKAVDTSGIYSQNYTSTDIPINTAETPLSTPTGLDLITSSDIATDGTNRVGILATWDTNAEADPEFHRYNLLLENKSNGNKQEVSTKETSYQFEVYPNIQYGIAVQAEDVSGNETSYSSEVVITSAKDDNPPAIPTWQDPGLIPGFKIIGLRWNKNTEVDLSHYEAQRSNTGDFTGGQVDLGDKDGNFTTDSELSVNTAYYYRVRAVDTSGNASGWSNIKSATTKKVGEAETDIAYRSVIANHISVSQLSAISADVGTLTAGVINSKNWVSSDGSEGTKIDLNNEIIKFGGENNPKLSWNGADIGLKIGDTEMGDYCEIDNGDINFYWYINGGHRLAKSLKKTESGSADSGESINLGYWKNNPKILLSPRIVDFYDPDYSTSTQSLECRIDSIWTNSDSTISFKPIIELSIGSATTDTVVNEQCSDNGLFTGWSNFCSISQGTVPSSTSSIRYQGYIEIVNNDDYVNYIQLKAEFYIEGNHVGTWGPTEETSITAGETVKRSFDETFGTNASGTVSIDFYCWQELVAESGPINHIGYFNKYTYSTDATTVVSSGTVNYIAIGE